MLYRCPVDEGHTGLECSCPFITTSAIFDCCHQIWDESPCSRHLINYLIDHNKRWIIMPNYDLATIRHSAAHIMAAAVQELYEDVRFDIGPATDNGFYYDFGMEHRLVPEDLKKIQKRMRKIIGRKVAFVRREGRRQGDGRGCAKSPQGSPGDVEQPGGGGHAQ